MSQNQNVNEYGEQVLYMCNEGQNQQQQNMFMEGEHTMMMYKEGEHSMLL